MKRTFSPTSTRLGFFFPPDLDSQALPPAGIHIFASQLHTHLTGRRVKTVLSRDGSEQEIVNIDNHYSPHFQVCGFSSGDQETARCFSQRHQYLPQCWGLECGRRNESNRASLGCCSTILTSFQLTKLPFFSIEEWKDVKEEQQNWDCGSENKRRWS